MPLPALVAAGIPAATKILSSLISRPREQQQPAQLPQYSDVQRTSVSNIAPMGSLEEQLQRAGVGAYTSALGIAGQPMPQELSLQNILSGSLPASMQQQIHEAAWGGIGTALREASRAAEEEALGRGIPLSSIQFSNAAGLQEPLLQDAARTEAGLTMQGIQGQQQLGAGMRQQYLQNLLALQSSPTLDRLTQLRLAAAPQTETELQRAPGQLPQGAYGAETSIAYMGRQYQALLEQMNQAKASGANTKQLQEMMNAIAAMASKVLQANGGVWPASLPNPPYWLLG